MIKINKINLFILILASQFFCCKLISKEKDIVNSVNNIDASFDKFINRFKEDSTFQQSRIVYPLRLEMFSEDVNETHPTVTYLNYAIISLKQKDWLEAVYFPVEQRALDTIIITVQGKESGLRVDHYFIKKEKQWVLYKLVDSST